MKNLLFFIIFISYNGFCQKNKTAFLDSLQKQYKHAKTDSSKAKFLYEIVTNIGDDNLGNLNKSHFDKAYDAYRSRLDIYENIENQRLFERVGKESDINDRFRASFNNDLFNYAVLMGATANSEEQLHYFKKAYQMAKDRKNLWQQTTILSNIAFAFQQNNNLDSAQFYLDKIFAKPVDPFGGYFFYVFYQSGDVRLEAGNYEQAKGLFLKGIENVLKNNFDLDIGLSINYLGLSKAYQHLNRRDSSYYYGVKSLNILKKIREIQVVKVDLASAYENMFEHFQRFAQQDSAFKYLNLAQKERAFFTKKTISNLAEFQQVLLKRQLTLKDLEREKIETQGRIRMYVLIATLLVFLGFGAVLLYNYLQKKKANVLLASQKEEIQTTLLKLKSTQSQLIQSEKLASLGELTAGIAHEIQNPLNFVNNFSEVSAELVTEMNLELEKGEIESAKEISNDLKQNLDKIHHHGKRASGIVKAMLEHSRTSTGNKELTNINTLADEYLRLSYHGLRAQDKTFNADFKAELDPNLPLIDAIPQDLGRVFLNLINNAFYACNERAKQNIKNGNQEPYKPMVIVSTQKTEDKIEIKVKDNGSGISEENLEKIFQPFFTTKPTGKGTGLGLSLAYDIITKGHGGSLEVESREGEGTVFTIKLA